MDAREEVLELLKKHKCVLLRRKKHEVWQLPNGLHFTRASTSINWRGDANSLQLLRKMLGLQVEERGVPGERRTRKKKHAKPPYVAPLVPFVDPDEN